MTHNVDMDGVDRSGAIKRTNFEWAESAYLTEVGQGRAQIDDTAGAIVVPGFKDIVAEEDETSPSRIFTGFAQAKAIRRGTTYRTEASREYQVTTLDENDLLRRRIIRGTDAKRPKETISQRTAWLLTELALVDVHDFGRVASSSVKLDKSDYRGQYPADVLLAMAKAVSWNPYVRWNTDQEAFELVFRNDNTSTDDTCTLSISNDLDEIDFDTVFPPWIEAELAQTPEHVYSGTYATGAKGHKYEHDQDTADEFVERDGVTEDVGIRSDSTLSRDARRFLKNSDSEEQTLPVKLLLPTAKVGLVQKGMRISTRMTHMEPEGWDPARYARIIRLRKSQPNNTGEFYVLNMDLSPQEDTGEGVSCPYELTESGTYYPLGGFHSADVPPTPNISNGPAYYCTPGVYYPTVPTENHQGYWNFGRYGDDVWGVHYPGGPGAIDWAGDCAQNELRFVIVGAGHFALQTEIYLGSTRPMAAGWGPSPSTGTHTYGAFNSGSLIEFDIEEDCVNIVRVIDGPASPCGGKWGWSAMEWTAA